MRSCYMLKIVLHFSKRHRGAFTWMVCHAVIFRAFKEARSNDVCVLFAQINAHAVPSGYAHNFVIRILDSNVPLPLK